VVFLLAKKWLNIGLATAMLATVALTGCGDAKEDTTTPGTTDTNALDATQELNLTTSGEPSSLDSSKATDSGSFTMIGNLNEGLVRLDKDGKVAPGVAKSWDISTDGLKYTFHLREDAKWSNGEAVTAKDFEFAWKRTLDPATQSQYAFIVTWIKGGTEFNAGQGTADQVAVKAIDDKTLEVTLESPKTYFLSQMAFPTYFPQNEKFVKAAGDKYGAEADKTLYNGPFKLTAWEHEQSMTFEKNENYWDKDAVKLTKVNWQFVNDNNARLNLYESGQIDIHGLVRDQIPQYKDSADAHTRKALTSWYFQFNQRVKALQNTKVRQALTFAIDAQAFVDVTLGNGSAPATSLTPWGVSDGQNGEYIKSLGDALNRKDNAPAKAKDLLAAGLKEAGEAEFPKIKLLISDDTTSKKMAEFVQEQWRQNLGITIDIEPVPSKLRFKRSAEKDFDIVISGWSPDYNDAMSYLEMWETGSDFNETGWSNKQYDELIKKAKAEADPKKHVQLMQDAEKLLLKEMPIGPLYFSGSTYLQKPYVKELIIPNFGPDYDLKHTFISGKK
jgi:oligopeptide transport system substrate-binding protein